MPLSPSPRRAQQTTPPLELAAYEHPDGAISVFPDGLFVEPYFAMRALLTGADLGLSTESSARRWIEWQLPRLERDSAFKRYCRSPGSAWSPCGAADADDASLALWIELLHRTAGSAPLPRAWARSVARAESALATLFDRNTGVYVISRTQRVSLFMDNIEVLSAIETVARAQERRGTGAAAAVARARATRLRQSIDRTFWSAQAGTYRVTTQRPLATPAFYPDVVAQLFPAAFGFGTPIDPPSRLVSRWMQLHGRQWLASEARDYPWGLLAAAALRHGDRASAGCWYGLAMSLRHGSRWNVLEEAVFQGLTPVVSVGGAPTPCVAPWR